MKILLVSATKFEVLPLLKMGVKRSVKGTVSHYQFGRHAVDVLIAGIGMTATAFQLGRTLNKKYDLVINAGVAGSFKRNIPLGTVVNVVSDCFADLGAEDGSKFLTLKEMGLDNASSLPAGKAGPKSQIPSFKGGKVLLRLKKAKGITVNTVHGNNTSIKRVVRKFKPDVESMEGAAFFLACNTEKIPCVQIRAISNYVERRNKKNWQLALAITNLNALLYKFLNGI